MSEETNNDEKTAANDEPQTSPVEESTEATLDEVNAEIEAELMDDMDAEAAEQEQQSETEQLKAQVATANDQVLRVQAEMQNVRRRAERDVEKAHKFGLEKLINGLLPVLDNFDRAIAAVPEAAADDEVVKSLLEGVELTRKTALDVLKTFSVEVLEPYGEPFNPEFHQAMTMVPSPTAEPNSVIDVLQKGYTLNGRLLRAAMVVIAKAEEA